MSSVSSDKLILEPGLELPPLPELFQQSTLVRGATSAATGELLHWEAPNGVQYLLKTFARKSWFSRVIFGRSSIKREWRMLNILKEKGILCAPAPTAKIGGHTIVMEFIPGKKLESLHHYRRENLPPPPKTFYLSLQAILHDLHEHGIAHGDFRRANIMVQPDNTPRLVDWATARNSETSSNLFFRQVIRSDDYSLVKVLSDSCPEILTATERAAAKPGPLLRLGRFFRQRIYRHILKPLWKKE